MKIISYKKHITTEITRLLNVSTLNTTEPAAIELATLNDTTYVAIPDNVALPKEQPPEIIDSIKDVTLTPELKAQIRDASPHCRLIAQRVQERIRERYSINDEQYFSRIGIGVALKIYEFQEGEQAQLAEFGSYIESCRDWGRQQRAALGL